MKQIFNFVYWILFATIALSACSKEDVQEIFVEQKTIIDAAYGNDAAQKADIYLPAGRNQSTTKVLLVIHGGGWMGGDKKDLDGFTTKFQAQFKDYAIVNMNYRLVDLTPRYMLPTQTDDIRSVMDYMNKNASEFGIKPEFVILGISAGGHLAMLYAYKYDNERRVKSVVNIVGPCDLNDSYYTNNFVYSLAMGYITAKENLPTDMILSVFGSPVTWISEKSPPTISFYGSADELIPSSQHSTLEQMLNQFKVPNEKYVYEGGHDIGATKFDDIMAKTLKFISTHVR